MGEGATHVDHARQPRHIPAGDGSEAFGSGVTARDGSSRTVFVRFGDARQKALVVATSAHRAEMRQRGGTLFCSKEEFRNDQTRDIWCR